MPITVHVDPGQILGPVTSSDDPRFPPGTQVGLRLADREGISEPSASVQGVIYPILVTDRVLYGDTSSDVTFEVLPETHVAPS
ncbi:hypothetical protein HNQ07_004016 [Deinococcus metalli]|uniref:Uncharacterized protein n=1 Tax=Deinococcus metalli TaxID=1141878 RepID=A0A7W8KL21_9DEIO|nr:hypothetical protein [Deinococcus metalli]MBB5378509.1 hypothetical protein [Deinococcus metalli]GHF58217.1 hypothetical protein GCM10017781_38100 [Deinococcus metalli]